MKKLIHVLIVGFLGPVLFYEPKSKQNSGIVFFYWSVAASHAIHDFKNLWIAIRRFNENGSEILSARCSCMAVAKQTCNHLIACLSKIE